MVAAVSAGAGICTADAPSVAAAATTTIHSVSDTFLQRPLNVVSNTSTTNISIAIANVADSTADASVAAAEASIATATAVSQSSLSLR